MASVILLTIIVHYFLPVVIVILIGYAVLVKFYTASSRELKRLGKSICLFPAMPFSRIDNAML